MSHSHYDPSGRAREQAERLVGALIDDEGHRGPGLDEEPVPIADVEQDVDRFTDQVLLLSEVGMGIPAVEVPVGGLYAGPEYAEDVVPVSLELLDRLRGEFWRQQLREDPRLVLGQLDRAMGEFDRSVEGFRVVEPERAVRSFRRRLTEFLSVRIDADSDGRPALMMRLPWRRGARPAAVPGCTFVVTTNSPGLRVFWSGAYFLTANYFSAPTSPASSTMQAGTYLFGVDGGAYRTVTWDTSAQVTLPGSPSVHLNF